MLQTHRAASSLLTSFSGLFAVDLCIDKNPTEPTVSLTVTPHPLLELITFITVGSRSLTLEQGLHYWRKETAECPCPTSATEPSNTPVFGSLGSITRDILINNDSPELLPQWPQTRIIFSSGTPCFKCKLRMDFTNAIKSSEHLLCECPQPPNISLFYLLTCRQENMLSPISVYNSSGLCLRKGEAGCLVGSLTMVLELLWASVSDRLLN